MSSSSSIGLSLLSRHGYVPGQGLGRHSQGSTSLIHVRVKNDTFGIGATFQTSDDMFRTSQDVFENVLQRLNQQKKDSEKMENSEKIYASKKQRKEEREEHAHVVGKEEQGGMESIETSFRRHSAKAAMYAKFKRGKDSSSYSKSSMQEILGKSGIEKKMGKEDTTVHTGLSTRDYFEKKMAERAVSAIQKCAVDSQESYYASLLNISQNSRLGLGWNNENIAVEGRYELEGMRAMIDENVQEEKLECDFVDTTQKTSHKKEFEQMQQAPAEYVEENAAVEKKKKRKRKEESSEVSVEQSTADVKVDKKNRKKEVKEEKEVDSEKKNRKQREESTSTLNTNELQSTQSNDLVEDTKTEKKRKHAIFKKAESDKEVMQRESIPYPKTEDKDEHKLHIKHKKRKVVLE